MIFPNPLPDHIRQDTALVPDEKRWSVHNAHDPSVFKDGESYYVFSTDAVSGDMDRETFRFRGGIQVRKSKDLIDWQWAGYAMDGVPDDANKWTGAIGMWAPEVFKFRETYFLYYCASKFGKNRSFIGVATSGSIEGPWKDQGEVYKTSQQNRPNAIDPNVVLDRHGNPWLIYGSFFGGIYANRLDSETGKLMNYGDGTLIACREHRTREGAIEGPYIVYHPAFDMYYLFVSYDSLKSNYNIRAARSREITGPYLDYNGRSMTAIEFDPSHEVGTKLMGGYRFEDSDGWLAPGHNSVLHDDGRYFIVHHARRAAFPKRFSMHVRSLYWTSDGWPVVSPERYAGETRQPVPEGGIAGRWEWIVHRRESEHVEASEPIDFLHGGRIGTETRAGAWELRNNGSEMVLELEIPGIDGYNGTVKGVVTPGWDWERNCGTILFSGLDERGTAVWAKRKSD